MSRKVEADKLLTTGEKTMLASREVRKGWPAIPTDPQRAAKWYYEGLPDSEKQRRKAAYLRATAYGRM